MTKRRKASRQVFRGPESRTAAGEVLALDPRAWGVEYYVDDDAEGTGPGVETIGGVAIVRICGPLSQRGGWWWFGYDDVEARFAEACASDAPAVLMVIDSPGGECAGLFETVKRMRELAESSGKRIAAYVDEDAYSAAYAIATVAGEIYLPEAAGVGSIGVIATVCDVTAMNQRLGINVAVIAAGARKTDGHPDVPISDDALEVFGERVEQLAAMFYAVVAESRPLSPDEIASYEAACIYGQDAVDAGLADAVMSFADVIAELGGGAMDDDAAAAASKGEKTTMQIGKSAAAAAAAIDILASPHVEGTPSEVRPGATSSVAAYKRTETSEVMEETESKDEDDGTETKTTTTTTTESETTESKESKDEDDDGDDDSEDSDDDDDKEDDDDDDKDKAAAVAPRVAAGSTSRDVLAAVRTLTGASSVGAQIGALQALADKAARVDVLEKRIAKLKGAQRKTTVAATVDNAIRAGLLTRAQRKWAIAAGTADMSILDGYLKTAKPVVARTALRMPAVDKTSPRAVKDGSPTGGTLTREEEAVAKTLAIDPSKLAAFKANGSKLPTITH